MSEPLSSAVEWHIVENTIPCASSAGEAIHMGPFATEEECRAVLASVKGLPRFQCSDLEVRRKYRRRERRIKIRLALEISRLATPDRTWTAHTVDISAFGARLCDSTECVQLGEILGLRCGQRQGVFRVVWLGMPNTATADQFGVECLSPETNIWDLDLGARHDDEVLLQQIARARTVQGKLFPRHQPPLRTLDYFGKCTQALTVGGDYFDFLDLGVGKVGFVLADVSGKGVAAALLMANLQGCIRNRTGTDCRDLRALLAGVNRHLFDHTEAHRYATLFFGCYDDDSRRLRYVNCGHGAPFLVHSAGEVSRLGATATVLGMFAEWDCAVADTPVEAGDVLALFTDGITETTAANGEEFGEERLVRVLQGCQGMDAAAILEQVERAVEQFGSAERPQDDLTLVVARAH